jgi:hypothetical protein
VVDAGPAPDASTTNPLLGILPGVRPSPACNQCVDVRCSSAEACGSNSTCVEGVACFLAACASLPGQGQQLVCAMKCFNGNIPLVETALQGVSCVYRACGFICTGP